MRAAGIIICALIALAAGAPQWPYRDEQTMQAYYGYQGGNNPSTGNNKYYRSTASTEDDDESESDSSTGRQDLKVAGVVNNGQSPQSNGVIEASQTQTISDGVVVPLNNNNQQVQVLETGSSKPVGQQQGNKQQGNQPFVGGQQQNSGPVRTPPAFPPANPPRNPSSQNPSEAGTENSSEEEDDDDDEEADAEDDDQEEDDDDDNEEEEDSRRRSEVVVPIATQKSNATTEVKPVKKIVKPVKKVIQQQQQQTVEALVPGYITDQGEVLVPFDTVSGGKKPVAIIPDPSYRPSASASSAQPPKTITLNSEGSSSESESKVIEPSAIPKFFNPTSSKKHYYSEVPPPGSIFTFDDDDDNAIIEKRAGRQDEESDEGASDEEEEEEEEEDDDAQNDDGSSEEEDLAPARPPLAVVKATAPSGEDDEAESLGIRPGSIARRMLAAARAARNSDDYYGNRYVDSRYYDFPPSRQNQNQLTTPNIFYSSNGYYVPRYANGNYLRRQQQQNYYSRPSVVTRQPVQQPIYYYRPASSEKVKVIPIANFDVSLEQDVEGGDYSAVVSPMRYYGNKQQHQQQQHSSISSRPTQVLIKRNENKPSLLALYNVEGGTPVTRQRSNKKHPRRQQRELKKKNKNNNSNNKKVKVNKNKQVNDPFGLLKKVKSN